MERISTSMNGTESKLLVTVKMNMRPLDRPRKARADRRFAKPREQLGWLLNFAQREDLPQLSVPQREQVEREVYAFCAARGGQGIAEELLSGDELNHLAKWARNILEMMTRPAAHWAIEIGDFWWNAERDQKTRRITSIYDGDFAALWPFLVNGFLIEQARNVGCCPRDGRFFVIIKRQRYCSSRCASYERKQRHRGLMTADERRRRQQLDYAHALEARKGTAAARHYRSRHGLEEGSG
jgi:hypothetical protein